MAHGRGEVVDGFARQAAAFAKSPSQRDPERLQRLMEWAAPAPGERALDLACGPGIVTWAMAERGALAIGIDLTSEMLREAVRARPLPAGEGGSAGGQAAYVLGEAGRMPFGDAVFALVVCRNTFHHLDDPLAVAREMARVTARGGRVVIEDMEAPEDPLDRDAHETIERLRDRTHRRGLTQPEMESLVAKAGLRLDREMRFTQRLDFDEWADRAGPSQEAKARARRIVEAAGAAGRPWIRVETSGDALAFHRRSLILRAVRA
jgi:SAM-dependent methyltransferase